jgi:hypothetical protein
MKAGVKVSARVRFEPRRKGTRCLVRTPETDATAAPRGRLPRITRLMALAIHFDALIQSGAVANYAELARLGNVTRARVTQIMNLLMLAPEIQEQILFLPRVEQGRGEVCLRGLQSATRVVAWAGQHALYSEQQRTGRCKFPRRS